MKIGIISDIHANLPALEKVYSELEKEVDEVYFLGDIVGYGPYPNECIEYLNKFGYSVLGNHDAAVADLRTYEDFNPYAQFAIDWTKERISWENIEKLRKLPLIIEDNNFCLVHGSIREPLDEYLINYYSVLANFEIMDENICFFGHSHLAGVFVYSDKEIYYVNFSEEGELKLQKNNKYLINPGSVGQPRDGNWKSSFVIYDIDKKILKFKRVAYDVGKIQNYMKLLGFPKQLWERLQYGR
jgi:predicted phosphodiesterase